MEHSEFDTVAAEGSGRNVEGVEGVGVGGDARGICGHGCEGLWRE